MGKHRLRNRIKSMVGSLIDPDKDEQLKGSNIETEENYKKILEIVKDEDQVDKSELVELIEEFHNRYNSIYERYDQITGKLQEKVRSKNEKEFEQQKNEELLALEKNYEEKIDNLRKELESITVQKQESDNLIECLRDEITNKNGDQERLLEEKDAHVAEIKQLQKKIDEMSAEIENGIQLKEQTVEQLEETIEDLKSDLEIKGDEVNMLTETIRNLEVKIRLSTQKLRVTEQTLSETEHEHAAKEEKLHQENKSLVEKISTLTQMIADIKREVQDQVNETLTGVDSLTVKFEEDYGHVRTRVTEITNEIQAMQIQLKQMKEDAKQKLDEMVTELKLSETENDRLMKSLEDMKTGSAKKDEKINELENTIHVKDERMLSFCEDKREAIKQLCIWADYHRDRFDHLQQLLKTSISTQRQTVR
ncbi:putative protein Networked (NET), actin-binding (NAB) [Helianthus annuus]|nr:putative protein Networked (NET), actin-binding (NAB) [Helianthus annuus]KAJ0769440.1 putative protein Networked (NET), actin-binding (NAB) [Helianthus annuus]